MNEIWKKIDGNTGYEVSNLGRIRSFFETKGREIPHILKPQKHYNGYETVCLVVGDEMRNFLIARIVAKAFIPNPKNKPQVNHKNRIKNDNRSDNLEWVTNGENQLHSWRENGNRKRIYAKKPNGNYTKTL